MEQYIPKSVLVAEIEKEIKDIYAGREYVGIPSWEEREIDGLEKAIKILNTIEVKEVDLEKEFDKCCENYIFDDEFEVYRARHFFKLGAKAQKGE